MAHKKLVAGSPLKTLSLLMAGQHAEVFSVDSGNYGVVPGALNMSQHHPQVPQCLFLSSYILLHSVLLDIFQFISSLCFVDSVCVDQFFGAG